MYKAHLYGGVGGEFWSEEERSCTCVIAPGRTITAAVGCGVVPSISMCLPNSRVKKTEVVFSCSCGVVSLVCDRDSTREVCEAELR